MDEDPRFRRPADLPAERRRWRTLRRVRPAQVPAPGPGEESVWDYPRPPRLEALSRRVEVWAGSVRVAGSDRPLRVCETASPPVYYLPRPDVEGARLVPAERESFCEWKGTARYWHVAAPSGRIEHAGWSYPEPDTGFEALADAVAFYPAHLACFLDGERVRPQPGGFYGGWVTREILGPFKGEPGTESW